MPRPMFRRTCRSTRPRTCRRTCRPAAAPPAVSAARAAVKVTISFPRRCAIRRGSAHRRRPSPATPPAVATERASLPARATMTACRPASASRAPVARARSTAAGLNTVPAASVWRASAAIGRVPHPARPALPPPHGAGAYPARRPASPTRAVPRTAGLPTAVSLDWTISPRRRPGMGGCLRSRTSIPRPLLSASGPPRRWSRHAMTPARSCRRCCLGGAGGQDTNDPPGLSVAGSQLRQQRPANDELSIRGRSRAVDVGVELGGL